MMNPSSVGGVEQTTNSYDVNYDNNNDHNNHYNKMISPISSNHYHNNNRSNDDNNNHQCYYNNHNGNTTTTNINSNTRSLSAAGAAATAAYCNSTNHGSETDSNHPSMLYDPIITKNLMNDNDNCIDDINNNRLVVVRYYLDRPGYGLHNSTARLWFHIPSICYPTDIQLFLIQQNILNEGNDMIAEIYIPSYGSYMLLDACIYAEMKWDFSNTSSNHPGFLNIRLTDVSDTQIDNEAEEEVLKNIDNKEDDILASSIITTLTKPIRKVTISTPSVNGIVRTAPATNTTTTKIEYANTVSCGLLSFSFMTGFECAHVLMMLYPNTVQTSFYFAWGPYMFFFGGILQICTAFILALRNNIYGTVAFFGFGCIWMSNGTKIILMTFFAGPNSGNAYEYIQDVDDWGNSIVSFYVLLFSLALLRQTFAISKLSTIMISLLSMKILCQIFGYWNRTMLYLQLFFGFATSLFAYYMFLVEFTNQVYHRDIYKTYKWDEVHSPNEIFGASGRTNTLQSKASRLRLAKFNDTKLCQHHGRQALSNDANISINSNSANSSNNNNNKSNGISMNHY